MSSCIQWTAFLKVVVTKEQKEEISHTVIIHNHFLNSDSTTSLNMKFQVQFPFSRHFTSLEHCDAKSAHIRGAFMKKLNYKTHISSWCWYFQEISQIWVTNRDVSPEITGASFVAKKNEPTWGDCLSRSSQKRWHQSDTQFGTTGARYVGGKILTFYGLNDSLAADLV